MGTATITGNISFPIAEGGPDASLVIGSPVKGPTDTTGPQLTFNEQSLNSYVVTVTGGAFTVPFGTISAADIFYLGTDQEITVTLNGGSDVFTIAAGGFILMSMAGITAVEVTATVLDAKIQAGLIGD